MKLASALAVFLVLSAASPAADHSLVHARRAQALLGPETWSQIIRVENRARASAYPATLHALVFELAGVLWFYTDVDGTQSFSLHRGRLAEEKADFAPLLRDIEPGFVRWTVVEADWAVTAGVDAKEMIPNGCFIESYAALRVLLARGEAVAEPRLLSYYAKTAFRRGGHTVLAYSVPGRVVVFDPLRPAAALQFPADWGDDPRRLARAVQGPEVIQARVLPLPVPAAREVFAVVTPGRTGAMLQ